MSPRSSAQRTKKSVGTSVAIVGSAALALDAPASTPELAPREPQAGEYWRAFKAYRNKSAGIVIRRDLTLLVEEVRFIDGVLHSVVLRDHPSENEGNSVWILAEFLDHFVFEPDGERIRAVELEAVQRDADTVSAAIAVGPSPEDLGIDIVDETLLALPTPKPGEVPVTALARVGGRELLEGGIKKRAELAKAQGAWITAKSKEMGRLAGVVGAFYVERTTAALAQVSGYVEYAKGLEQGVNSLGLYLGDGVVVETIATGDDAPSDIPLTLFQRRLYMDEEFAVNLLRGGATWDDWDAFAEAMRTDSRLRDTVLPTPRCVVAMRVRKREQQFDMGDALAATRGDVFAAFDRLHTFLAGVNEDRRTFLLIRNGDNVHCVWSELSTDQAPRLFPTEDEKQQPFKKSRFFHGVDEDEITPESTRYYEARTEYDKIILFYRRLMLLMWGLNDRLSIFGTFYDAGQYPNFMSLRLQMERFNYVYDDETGALGDGWPTFDDWWAKKNAYLASGSRVLCHWRRLLTPDRAPSCAKWRGNGRGEYNERLASPAEPLTVAIAKKRGEAILVEPEVVSTYSKRKFKAKVRLSAEYRRGYDGVEYGSAETSHAYLVLDTVTLEEIEYYVNSRAARSRYESYLAIFLAAKAILTTERAAEATLRSQLATELRDAFRSASEVERGRAIDDAIRLWRNAAQGAPLPAQNVAGFAEMLRALRSTIDEALRGGRTHIPAAANAAEIAGRKPLRLTLDGKGRAMLYASTLASEIPFSMMPYPWVRRARITFDRGGSATLGAWEPVLMRQDDPSERALHEWPEAAALALPVRTMAPYELRLMVALREAMDNAAGAIHEVLDIASTPPAAFAAHAIALIREYSRRSEISPPSYVIPIALARKIEGYRNSAFGYGEAVKATEVPYYSYGIVVLEVESSSNAWHSSDEARDRLVQFWASYARTPSLWMQRSEDERPTLHYVALEAVAELGLDKPFARKNGFAISKAYLGQAIARYYKIPTGSYRSQDLLAKVTAWGDALVDAYEALVVQTPSKKSNSERAPEILWTAAGVLNALRGRTVRKRVIFPKSAKEIARDKDDA